MDLLNLQMRASQGQCGSVVQQSSHSFFCPTEHVLSHVFFCIIGKYKIFQLWNVMIAHVPQFLFWFHSGKIEV